MTNKEYSGAEDDSHVGPLPPWMGGPGGSGDYEVQDAVGTKRAYVMCAAGHRSVPYGGLFGEMDTRFSTELKDGSDYPRCGVENCDAESWIGWIDLPPESVDDTPGD